MSEGGQEDTGIVRGANRGFTPLITNNDTNIYPLIAYRLNSAYKHVNIKLISTYISCTSTSAFNWYLLLNPTVTGTAFSFSSVSNSGIEIDVSRTNATTLSVGSPTFLATGTILASGTGFQTNEGNVTVQQATDFALGTNIAGVSDIVVLAIQRVTGTSESFYASINWREQQ
jgi:hypothetical protein